MPLFEVTMRRIIEWNDIYEARTPEAAAELARLEAQHGTVIDEHIDVKALQPAQ